MNSPAAASDNGSNFNLFLSIDWKKQQIGFVCFSKNHSFFSMKLICCRWCCCAPYQVSQNQFKPKIHFPKTKVILGHFDNTRAVLLIPHWGHLVSFNRNWIWRDCYLDGDATYTHDTVCHSFEFGWGTQRERVRKKWIQ